jgi:hypothetical protein
MSVMLSSRRLVRHLGLSISQPGLQLMAATCRGRLPFLLDENNSRSQSGHSAKSDVENGPEH